MIPKIIHYCWLSNDPVPKNFKKYMHGWKEKLKDYQFVKWDFSKFPKEKSLWVSEAFDNKKYAFAADYIRLFAVYNYGGIYLDMDVEVLKSFNDLICCPYMFARERPDSNWIEAGCFGAEKENDFIGKCLEWYKDRTFIKPDGSFDQMPLPQIMDKVRKKNKIHLKLYPWYYFTAKSYETGVEKPTKKTYTVHHFAASWKTKNEIRHIELVRKYSKLFGYKVGHNIADYQSVIEQEGIKGIIYLTKNKISKKINKI